MKKYVTIMTLLSHNFTASSNVCINVIATISSIP